MPRGKGIYEDEPREHLEGAKATGDDRGGEDAPDEHASDHAQEAPD